MTESSPESISEQRSTRPPYLGRALTAFLESKLSVGPEPGIQSVAIEFRNVYEHLSEAASRIIVSYKDILAGAGFNPGRVRLYMGGGRLKGKPLREDSDIDLFFTVDNTQESLNGKRQQRYAD